MVREALQIETQGRVKPANITVAFSDTRIQDAWDSANILVARKLDPHAISRTNSLRFIQATSAGLDEFLPIDWLPANAILCNASGVHAEKAREFGPMAVLMLHEHVPAQITAHRMRYWNRNFRPTSHNKRVLIFGAGALGSAVADGLSNFKFQIFGIGRRDKGARAGFHRTFGPDALDSLLPETDILIIAAPLTPETQGRFGRRELSLLPEGASIMNISRPSLLDHEALVDLLVSKRLAGAILDVLEEEPLPSESPLWDVPNLMIFPHVSGDNPFDYARGCAKLLGRNLAALLDGRPLLSQVDPDLGY